MNKHIQVMLVEDHPEYRESIQLILSKEVHIELSHQFGTAEQALHYLQYEPHAEKPDLILLDLNLPGLNGIEALPWFKKYLPKAEIIMLTQSDAETDVVAAIAAGATGYLLKSSNRNQIKEAIGIVLEGGSPLDPKVARYILNILHDKKPQLNEAANEKLSERELEILALLGEGLVKKEIGDKLGISSHTVNNHIRHIYEKLHVQNAPAAITKAYRTGIFSSDEEN